MDYKKFMTPIWVGMEQRIIEYFGSHGIDTFWNCPEVEKAMILPGREVGGMYCQSHHLFNYWKHTKKELGGVRSFVEFGGGYGMMCRMARMINPNPYSIIDLPVINKIQQYYLRNVSGVNFVGVDHIEDIDNISPLCDMFISLYALSECTDECVEYVLSKKFFNANHILMCFRKQDNKDFKMTKYIPEFKKFGDVIEMDAEGLYLIK